MKQYIDLCNTILETGKRKPSGRNIPDTISCFGLTYQVDMADGFPLLTTKKMPFKSIVRENIWFLSGSKSIKGFNIPFWDAWVDEKSEVPSPYGYYWRQFPNPDWDDYYTGRQKPNIDQFQKVIDTLKTNPFSRRLVVSAWEPNNAWSSILPPCHLLFIFNYDGERLNLHLTQRSGDVPIGIPFNLAGYALLLHIVCNIVNMIPGVFSHSITDAHIYVDQIDLIKEQLLRIPYKLPTLNIKRKLLSLDDIKEKDFELIDYISHDKINYPVAV